MEDMSAAMEASSRARKAALIRAWGLLRLECFAIHNLVAAIGWLLRTFLANAPGSSAKNFALHLISPGPSTSVLAEIICITRLSKTTMSLPTRSRCLRQASGALLRVRSLGG